jgi:hypothetical protein
MVRYTYFLENVGRENYPIKKETTDGKRDLLERMNYGLTIDISEGQEGVMMSIILDASPQVISDWDQVDGISVNLLHSLTNPNAPDDIELNAYSLKTPRLRPMAKSLPSPPSMAPRALKPCPDTSCLSL